MKFKKKMVVDFLSSLRKNEKSIDALFSFFDNNNIHCAILGGAVRSALSEKSPLRDIDLICDCEHSLIEEFLNRESIEYMKNFFGGYKFKISSTEFDLWFLDNHYYFKNKIYKPYFRNIYRTTFINYDSVCYDITENKLYIQNYKNLGDCNILDFVGNKKSIEKNPNPELSICKLFLLEYVYKYKFSNSIINYIDRYIVKNYNFDSEYIFNKLNNAYVRHYKQKMDIKFGVFLRNEIDGAIKRLNFL